MNMIEKMARAIAKIAIADMTDQATWDTLEAAVDDRWDEYVPEAMAALDAMLDPTSDMITAGGENSGEIYRRMVDQAMNPDILF